MLAAHGVVRAFHREQKGSLLNSLHIAKWQRQKKIYKLSMRDKTNPECAIYILNSIARTFEIQYIYIHVGIPRG